MVIQDLTPLREGADAAWQAVQDGTPLASCSLWWSNPPQLPGERPGLIGHFEAADPNAASLLLHHACRELQARGCTLAIGPINGSTWRRYRLIVERGSEPPFFLEPDNPDSWPSFFTDAGFHVLASYSSAKSGELELDDPRADRVWARLQRQGFSIRPLDLNNFDQELGLLYQISVAAFAQNFLYQPITSAEFAALYQPVKPLVHPGLVLIAHKDHDPAAYVFALPDRQPGTFIIKTMAAHPNYAGRGLGTVLLIEVNRAAAQLGFQRSIHALMHDANQSTRISARQARVFRRYALFARSL